MALYKGFDHLTRPHLLPRGVSGRYDERWFDYWRFVGHELLVTLFVSLMRTDRWEIVGRLLAQEFLVENPSNGNHRMQTYEYFSHTVQFFYLRDQQKRQRSCVSHCQKIGERHGEGGLLAERIPIREFAETDYLLGLRSAFSGSYDRGRYHECWIPNSIYSMFDTPRFLYLAQQRSFAERLLGVLAVPSIESLRSKFNETRGFLAIATDNAPLPNSIDSFDANSLGSR